MMISTLFVSALAFVSMVLAAPVPSPSTSLTEGFVKRNCAQMPTSVDTGVRDTILRTMMSLTSVREMWYIALLVSFTESMINALPCGDRNSTGPFQQQANYGWCQTQDQCTQPVHSTIAFFNALEPIYNANPNEDPGVIGQKVQNAIAGNEYTKNEGVVDKIFAEALASVGASPASTTTSKTASSKTSTSTSSTDSSSATGASNVEGAPPSSGGASNVEGAPPSSGSGSDSSDDDNSDEGDCECTQEYTPKPGDYCQMVADQFGISLEEFYVMNDSIDSDCTNLIAGQPYCVAQSSNSS